MPIRFPDIPEKLGLGVGLDMPWGAPHGFVPDSRNGDRPSSRLARFFERSKNDFAYAFLSYQPRSRGELKAGDYFPAFDRFFELAPAPRARALHHTILNLATTEPYDRASIIEFTNALVARYDLKWINEDLGLWSLGGQPLPYPLPPYLTRAGLEACIANVREYQSRLAAPLLVEFPGFSEGTNFFIGRMDAYDFFREVVEATDSPCTLDTGHLISYRWLQGKRGGDLFRDLDRLPLDHCFEIHLSGCQISNGRFMDFHHGVIMDEQLDLLKILLAWCPNVKAVTFEDPKVTDDGELIEKSRRNFERLKETVAQWKRTA